MGIGTIERLEDKWSRIVTRLYTRLLSSQFKEIGPGARVSPPFRYHGLNQISLGEKVMIHRDCWIQVVGGPGDDESSKIVIKAHAGIGMGSTISAAQQVVIEEYVLLARNVYISDHAHAYENLDVPVMHQGIDHIAPVSIGRHTWLGQNVVVLPGVAIGQHCVIGANAVVNSSIPDFSVAVGAPARVVKQYDRNDGQWKRVG
jgi:acetyltransferase-like isoleucine patch superfamily enzyme